MVRLVTEMFFSTLPNRFIDCGPLASVSSFRRGRNMVFYRKNVPGTERVIPLIAGIAMISYGLMGLPVGYVIACVGAISVLTGFVGYCPACAVAGRKTLP
jgi:hypothetical protein